MVQKKPDSTRGTLAFVVIVVLGFGLGALIKHVNVGLLLGLGIGLLASGLLRKR